MDKNTKALLSLPAVRFAPFFAAGMLAAYHTEAAVLIFAAAALLALSLIKFRKAAVSAADFSRRTPYFGKVKIFY